MFEIFRENEGENSKPENPEVFPKTESEIPEIKLSDSQAEELRALIEEIKGKDSDEEDLGEVA